MQLQTLWKMAQLTEFKCSIITDATTGISSERTGEEAVCECNASDEAANVTTIAVNDEYFKKLYQAC